MADKQLDQSKADAFAERILDTVNKGCLSLMISLGHRTGLFDRMSTLPPSTSEEIATAANLNERYVREWLGAMVAGEIVDYDPTTKRYSLSPEHAACLTRDSAPNNIAAYSQYIAQLGCVETEIVDCFHKGGGVPYSKFKRFHEIMAEDSGQTVIPAIMDHILPLVPGLITRLQQGIDVLDIGCGRGLALILMARHFPASRFHGIDLSEEAVAYGRNEAEKQNLHNVKFDQKDLTEFPLDDRYDLITAFDAIHDQKAPDKVLAGIHAHLNSDGVFLMQDISASRDVEKNITHPIGILIYTISCMHCMTVSLAQGGAGLGAAWGRETAEKMLKEAGFSSVTVHDLPHDFQNCYFVARP